MNVNVYLPDDVGRQAKEADLPLSRLLRDAVTEELERRAAVASTLTDPEEFILTLEDKDGRLYDGRLEGRLLAYDDRSTASVFLANDGRVILHNPDKANMWVIDDAAEELRDVLEPGAYVDVLQALGIKPVIDI